MGKIYLHAIPTGGNSFGIIRDAEATGDVIGYALCEDGECIASHFCYRKKYPDGFDLEWVDYEDLDTHIGYAEAYKRNQAMKEN